ncbi:methyltransferase domain-containing protein [Rubritalea profundi]|uniref:Arsenite methyltransferase n=1 Tax=Rubritalea profundi TaxID=1658618 RepID=A0A2S7U029_9BACT|nr:methyltransferase domain-containing protein [Rubritalea profundi]PQJ27553.1 methyltransferase [Rubritalea profundi]
MKTESAVKARYAAAANQAEAALCCPVDYDPKYLKVIPQEVIEKDYGCGDPSKWLKPGETVLDLGSGTGKICFIAAQVVGEQGKVIGVDMTDDMLEVAERNAPIIADAIGYSNVEFRKGRIQDLALDLKLLEEHLSENPVTDANAWMALAAVEQGIREKKPLVEDNSVNVVVSNCVLNLVEPELKEQMFQEIYRVLKKGGRAVISDIVADEEVPLHLQKDAQLWSGCISGAMTEEGFLKAFEDAGFYGVEFVKFESNPWQTVEGIEFRSVTVQAWKGKEGPCLERNQAVVYNGPFKKVLDDDGHAMERGKRYAVCEKTYNLYKRPPYCDSFTLVDPIEEVPLADAEPFDCSRTAERHPRETKGQDYKLTTASSDCCDGDSCC